jgi:hypothetical protein
MPLVAFVLMLTFHQQHLTFVVCCRIIVISRTCSANNYPMIIIIWLFWLRLRLIVSTLIILCPHYQQHQTYVDLVAVPKSFQEHRRRRSLDLVEEVVVYNHLDKRDHMSCPVGSGGDGVAASTVISILSDTVRPVESVTVRSTLYVPA